MAGSEGQLRIDPLGQSRLISESSFENVRKQTAPLSQSLSPAKSGAGGQNVLLHNADLSIPSGYLRMLSWACLASVSWYFFLPSSTDFRIAFVLSSLSLRS